MNSRLAAINSIKADQRVDLEVGKVEIYVDGVQADEEVDEGLLLFGGDVGEERRCDGGARGERCIDGDVELEGFSIDIADVHTTFVGEEDRVAFACGVDADVVFGVGRVRKEGLDDEVVEGTSDSLNLCRRRHSPFGGFPAWADIHSLASSQVLLSARRPALPRRLISWSGFATSLDEKTQPGSWVSGVMALVSGSQEI
jgi:hypothetical protein